MPEDQLNLFAGGFHVRMFRLQESARAWLESGADFGSNSLELLTKLSQNGLSSKMSPACYPATTEKILPSSFIGWQNAGMALPGGFLTLNISESPNEGAECLLSQVLEADVAPKYYLSRKAAQGILRRAEKRGKELPKHLQFALENLAGLAQKKKR